MRHIVGEVFAAVQSLTERRHVLINISTSRNCLQFFALELSRLATDNPMDLDTFLKHMESKCGVPIGAYDQLIAFLGNGNGSKLKKCRELMRMQPYITRLLDVAIHRLEIMAGRGLAVASTGALSDDRLYELALLDDQGLIIDGVQRYAYEWGMEDYLDQHYHQQLPQTISRLKVPTGLEVILTDSE